MRSGFTKRLAVVDVATLVGVVIATLFGSWWSFAVVVWIGSYERARRGGDEFMPSALIATFAWFVISIFRDAVNGFRISSRIAGFFSLAHGSLLYVVLVVIAFVIASLSSGSGTQLGRLGRSQSAR